MRNLNLTNFKKNDFNGIEFFPSNEVSGWFIAYARIDSVSYKGHLSLDYDHDFLDFEGNIIILRNDNYVDDLELIIQENNENYIVSFRFVDGAKYNLVVRLNSNLEVLELGNWDNTQIKIKQNVFLALEELIGVIEEVFFFYYFEGY